jgi:hypothetical protein
MEQQLVAECEKLIFAIRQIKRLGTPHALAEAETCANEVEDFIVNNCDE